MDIATLAKNAHDLSTRLKYWTDKANQGHELAKIMRELADVVDAIEPDNNLDVGEELADVVVCLCIFAEHYNIELESNVAYKLDEMSKRVMRFEDLCS